MIRAQCNIIHQYIIFWSVAYCPSTYLSNFYVVAILGSGVSTQLAV